MKNKIVKSLAISLTALMTLTSVNVAIFAQPEISPTTQTVAEDTNMSKTFLLEKNGSAAGNRAKFNFVFRQADYQTTGIIFWPEQSYDVTVTGLQSGDPLPSIAFSQNIQKIGENVVNKVKLKGKVDENGTLTTTVKAPSDTFQGALYLMNPYTDEQQKGNPSITIKRTDGKALDWYPVYKEDGDFEAFKKQLKDYKELKEEGINGRYPQYVDLVSDRTIISTSFDAAYDIYVEGKDSNGKEIKLTPDEALKTADQALEYEYAYAGLTEAEYPKQRQQMRAIARDKPFFATNEYVGFDNGAPEYYSYEILKPDFIKGWGTLHEYGHVIENASIKLAESTNNLYVLDAIKKFVPNSISRLVQEKRYERLFSTYSSQKNNVSFWLYSFEKDNSNYVLEELSIWDRLVIFDQLNQYFRKIDGTEFWTEITKTSRETPLKGVPVNDSLNKIVVLAAKRYKMDIRPFFRLLNLDERFVYFSPDYYEYLDGEALELVKSLDNLPKINPLTRYIDETYVGNEDKGLNENAKAVINSIESKGTSNKLTIKLEGDTTANLLGYEIYRTNAGTKLNLDTDFIGYAKSSGKDTTTFMDTLNVSDYRFDYYVKPVSKKLEYANISEKVQSSGNPKLDGTIKVTDITYNQFVDVLSVKGKGYSAKNNNNETFMQLVINDQKYDTTDKNIVVNPNTGDKNKNFIHFYPQSDGSWEMRIVGFDKLELGDNLEIKANFMEIEKVPTSVAGQTEDLHKVITYSNDILRNLGDISESGNTSPLIKSIQVKGIKGDVDQKFDPLNFSYTEALQYVKQSLSETDSNKTILEDPIGELMILPELADLHATYTVNVTPYTYDYTSGKGEIIKGETFKAKDGAFKVDYDRAGTYKWHIKVDLTTSNGEQQAYEFDVYSPSEDAYLDDCLVRNNAPDENNGVGQSDIKEIDGWDYTKDHIYVQQVGDVLSSEAQARSVILKGILKPGSQADWEVYHKATSGDIDRDIKILDKTTCETDLTTEKLLESDTVYFAVTAQDGVTIREYNIIFKLPEDAKQTANLRDIEISGQGEKNVGYVKNYVALDKSKLPNLTKNYYDYDGIYTIAPTVFDDGNVDLENVALTIRPIVDYYTKALPAGETPKISWDFWKIGLNKGTSIKLNHKNKPADILCPTEDGNSVDKIQKDIKIRPSELKKLDISNGDYVWGDPFKEFGQIMFNSPGYNLRMTLTSADGSKTVKYLFYFEPSGKAPLETTNNFNGNIKIYDKELYDPTNPAASDIGGVIEADQYYIYEAADPNNKITFKPIVYEGTGTLHEIIDGNEIQVQGIDNEYTISKEATGFVYRIKAPDNSRTYTYRFSKYRPTDSSLKSLTTNGYLVHLDDNGNPVEGFDPNVKEYYMLTNDLNNIQFDAAVNDSNSATVATLDGREWKSVPTVKARSFAEVKTNKPTGEVKELEINVSAQSDSTSTYSVIVSDEFDFLNNADFIGDTEKTDLTTKIDTAKVLLDKGNFDNVLYDDLTSAYNNAIKLSTNNYITKDEYSIVINQLDNLIIRYSEIMSDAYVDLYNNTVTTEENSILKTPTLLREKISGNEFITNGSTLVFYAGNGTDVTIPEGISEIGAYAFSGCTELTNINLNNVTSIGYAAFEGCINLKTISSLDNVTLAHRSLWDTQVTVSTDKNWLYDADKVLIGSVTINKNLTIPTGVKSIDAYAFHGLNGVVDVTIPYTVTNIGSKAFYGSSTELTNAIFAGNRLTLDQVFSDGVTITNMDIMPSYTLTLDQQVSEGVKPNFGLKGAGIYNAGNKVELVAPFDSNYTFDGWKYDGDDTYFSTSPTTQITVIKDAKIIACYTPAPKYTLTLNYDENGGIVNSDKVIENNVINEIKYDGKVILTAVCKDNYKFDGWYANNRLLSNEVIYTASVVQNETIEAKFIENTKYTVTFADTFNKVYGVSVVSDGENAIAPDNPTRPGYTFDGWDKDFSKVTSNMTVYPKWKKDVVNYQIRVENGKLVNGKTEGSFTYCQLVIAAANPAPRNKVFSHWEDANGNVMSYDSVYSFAATSNITLKAVYADEKKEEPISVLTNVLVNKITGKISFIAKAVVPDGYEKVECGVAVLKDTSLNGELTLNTLECIRAKSATQNQYGEYSLVTSIRTTKRFYGRAYLTYRNVKTGELVTIYSANTECIDIK